MRRYCQNIRDWEGTNAAHLIPAGQQLKEILEEQCTITFLDKHFTWFSAKDVTFKHSYILINFISTGKDPGGTIYNHYWTLQNLGLPHRPLWRLTTRDHRERFISLVLPEDKPLQLMLERCFGLHRWLIDRETLQQIVEG